MDRYAVLDPSGKVVNVIVWDGQAEWTPPKGHTLKQSQECFIGDIWYEELKEFVRPMSVLKPPEDESSIAERKSMYESSKQKLKSSMFFLNLSGTPEV